MTDKYILDGHNAVPCDDLMKWAKWIEKADRHVAQETRGEVRVSTVFLGLDHSFGGPTPILFETMIFGGEHDGYQQRCSTWDEAAEMHKRACELVWPTEV